LTVLHANIFVLDDLQQPNIIFDADGKIKFIDINRCGLGRYNMKIRDENLADGRQKQIENMGRAAFRSETVTGPLAMSTKEGMCQWAYGTLSHTTG
jgi:hypothetical protein